MSGNHRTTDLQETDAEFLLFIHASKKERAKSIDNRRWDPTRTCWVYPETARHYDGIIAELGDELVNCSVNRPTNDQSNAVSTFTPAKEMTVPHEKATYSKAASSPMSNGLAENDKPRTELINKDKQANELQRQLNEDKLRIEDLNRRLESRELELKNLHERCERQSQELAARETGTKGKTPGRICKELAEDATGTNISFMEIGPLKLDDNFPIELAKCVEEKLRSMLQCHNCSVTFHDLIMQAKDAELLPDEAIDMTHTIRKQRNITAHSRFDPQVQLGRIPPLFIRREYTLAATT